MDNVEERGEESHFPELVMGSGSQYPAPAPPSPLDDAGAKRRAARNKTLRRRGRGEGGDIPGQTFGMGEGGSVGMVIPYGLFKDCMLAALRRRSCISGE